MVSHVAVYFPPGPCGVSVDDLPQLRGEVHVLLNRFSVLAELYIRSILADDVPVGWPVVIGVYFEFIFAILPNRAIRRIRASVSGSAPGESCVRIGTLILPIREITFIRTFRCLRQAEGIRHDTGIRDVGVMVGRGLQAERVGAQVPAS